MIGNKMSRACRCTRTLTNQIGGIAITSHRLPIRPMCSHNFFVNIFLNYFIFFFFGFLKFSFCVVVVVLVLLHKKCINWRINWIILVLLLLLLLYVCILSCENTLFFSLFICVLVSGNHLFERTKWILLHEKIIYCFICMKINVILLIVLHHAYSFCTLTGPYVIGYVLIACNGMKIAPCWNGWQ